MKANLVMYLSFMMTNFIIGMIHYDWICFMVAGLFLMLSCFELWAVRKAEYVSQNAKRVG